MINSMTGFASAQQDFGRERINLELRAVNHRYLDLQFKMADDLRVPPCAGLLPRGKAKLFFYPQGQKPCLCFPLSKWPPVTLSWA